MRIDSMARKLTCHRFITSANNNILRITSLLHKLCERFSPPLISLENPDGLEETTYRLFPPATSIPPEGLEPVLRELGFGYRAGYLASSLASLNERGCVETELERWRSLPLDELREELLQLKGVGRKVADCVMLMCMDQVRSSASGEVLTLSRLSFPSTPTSTRSQHGTPPSRPASRSKSSQRGCTTTSKSFSPRRGDRWPVGVRPSCLQPRLSGCQLQSPRLRRRSRRR